MMASLMLILGIGLEFGLKVRMKKYPHHDLEGKRRKVQIKSLFLNTSGDTLLNAT